MDRFQIQEPDFDLDVRVNINAGGPQPNGPCTNSDENWCETYNEYGCPTEQGDTDCNDTCPPCDTLYVTCGDNHTCTPDVTCNGNC